MSGDCCAEEAERVLRGENCDEKIIEQISYCIRVHSFSRGIPSQFSRRRSLQDADWLDAIGAIGIARCFATCCRDEASGRFDRRSVLLRRARPTTRISGIDHFYKKLLKINIIPLSRSTAREIAAQEKRIHARLPRAARGEI